MVTKQSFKHNNLNEGYTASFQVLDEIETQGGQILFEKLIQKTKAPSYVSHLLTESVLLLCKQDNMLQNIPIVPCDHSIDQSPKKQLIDNWATQALKKPNIIEEKNTIQNIVEEEEIDYKQDDSNVSKSSKQLQQRQSDYQDSKYFRDSNESIQILENLEKQNSQTKNQTQHSIKTLKNEKNILKQDQSQKQTQQNINKKQVTQLQFNFFPLPKTEESEDEPTDAESIAFQTLQERLRNERQNREINNLQNQNDLQIEKNILQAQDIKKQKTVRKQMINFDYDGKPINIKQMKDDQFPSPITQIQYIDLEPKVSMKPYQNLNLELQETQQIPENLTIEKLQVLQRQSQMKDEKVKKQIQTVYYEENIQLKTGVKVIKEDGSEIRGREYAQSNRPRKKDYDLFIKQDISETSHGYSIQKPQLLQENNNLNNNPSQVIEDDDKSDSLQYIDEKRFNNENIKQNQNINIHIQQEYGKMVYSLNNNPQKRIQTAKPALQSKIKEQTPRIFNRIHSYKPEHLVQNLKNYQIYKNTLKVEQFNEKIQNDDKWGQEDRNKKAELPNLAKDRPKSAKLIPSARQRKRNI